jgi:transmembrane sensor
MTNPIELLLAKYFSNSITPTEYKQLQEVVAAFNTEELESFMESYWLQYSPERKYRKHDFEELTAGIANHVKPISIPSGFKKFWRAAAAIILPLLIAATTYFYIRSQQLETHFARQMNVQVKSGERAHLLLPDGTTVRMNAASSITYPTSFGFQSRNISLNGEAFFTVTKDSIRPFIVETPYLQVRVLGTVFNIDTYESADKVETTLLEGTVRIVTKGDNPQVVMLKPNEKAVYHKKTGELNVEATDLRYETAWLNGELIFRSATFEEIIRVLSRFYGIEVDIVTNKVHNERYTGSFNAKNMTEVLDLLQFHYQFNYTLQNSKAHIVFR